MNWYSSFASVVLPSARSASALLVRNSRSPADGFRRGRPVGVAFGFGVGRGVDTTATLVCFGVALAGVAVGFGVAFATVTVDFAVGGGVAVAAAVLSGVSA